MTTGMTATRAAIAMIAFALALPAVVSGATDLGAAKPPVSSFVDPTFGKVLSRTDKQVLYYWQVEKKAGGKVRCVGACAKAWPPLIVKSAKRVSKRIAGLSGTFGTVRRPDGRLQVTRNKLPVYTYAHERPRQVLCDNVDGWFVVRL
jgi:predicted lipoprotein with Yx(FWY)xxD motif